MLADSLTELFAARALVYETARAIDAGADVKVQHAQCSMAKLYASEMAGRVADRAVQVFGGRGYMRENVAERFFRELRVERIWEGTSEVQRAIIADQMVKRGPARPGLSAPRPEAALWGGAARPGAGSGGEAGLDGGDDLGGLGLGHRAEPRHGLAVRADQELLEVPLDVPGVALGVGQGGRARCRPGAGRRR